MIISASRRTDIPAFYSDWFMHRIGEGYLSVRNPFNAKQVRRVSLRVADVTAIVFWTRNPSSILPHLPTLDAGGFHYYFQFTVTGYPRSLEQSVPNTFRAIDTFSRLSDLIGPGRIIWRYDPILLCNILEIDEHKRLFSKICTLLRGKTRRVVISFADLYGKSERNLRKVPTLVYRDMVKEEDTLHDLAVFMSNLARTNGMQIQSCSEEIELSQYGIEHGKCIDDDLLMQEFGVAVPPIKDPTQRAACGCVKSVDIGQYNTCLHGCAYCYATCSGRVAHQNWDKHDPSSPFLIGSRGNQDAFTDESCPDSEQRGLF